MDSTAVVPSDLKKANFYNSIVYGPNMEELILSKKEPGLFNYQFDHCLLRSNSLINTISNTTIIWNKDPEFKLKPKMYLELDTLSPAKDKGDVSIGQMYPLDLKRMDRTIDQGPDLGAYERVEKK
jgi:hypothetical protein